MPGSSDFGKLYTALMITQLVDSGLIKTIIDVGVGRGTYYELLSPHLPQLDWTGVEVWAPYIDQFNLHNKYTKLINQDVREINFEAEPQRDLAILGDILEHMPKSDAQKIINTILDKSRTVVISIPITHYPQDEINNNPFEKHIKDDWSHKEVLESFPHIITSYVHDHIGVYFLSRDIETTATLKSIYPFVCDIVKKQLPNDQIRCF